MSLKKVSIIIPVLNEAETIEEVVCRIERLALQLEVELVIIDDGSTDGSTEIIGKLCQNERRLGIFLSSTSGKGSAVARGIEASTGDIILIHDADLEYDQTDIPKLIEPILKGETRFVLGSRTLGAGSYILDRGPENARDAALLNVGSLFLNCLFYGLYGKFLTDPQSMYKIFERRCLDGICLQSTRFDLDWELVCKFVRRGYLPLEIPVTYRGRSVKDGKKLRIWSDGCRALWAIFRYRFSKSF